MQFLFLPLCLNVKMEHYVCCTELPFEEAGSRQHYYCGTERKLEKAHRLFSHEQICIITPSLNLSMTY